MRFYATKRKTDSILYFIICQKHSLYARQVNTPAALKKSRFLANFQRFLTRYRKGPRRKTSDHEPRTGVEFPPAAGAGSVFPALDL